MSWLIRFYRPHVQDLEFPYLSCRKLPFFSLTSYVIISLVCGLYQDELAEQTLKAVCRKFSTSAKVWLRHISWLLSKDRADAARKVMDKSFDALPQRKHIKASALPCPASPPFLSPLSFLLVCILLCHPSKHSAGSHSVRSASTPLNYACCNCSAGHLDNFSCLLLGRCWCF